MRVIYLTIINRQLPGRCFRGQSSLRSCESIAEIGGLFVGATDTGFGILAALPLHQQLEEATKK